ncbi:MAG: NAD(P)(+) transhydrogenase (Re/Si-specific) subunit beta, partial [Candidatus Altiarchaeota archaeon]|nr:NAD(P)(+) transhydrogenase (Re/Si-specific) subunit beta [Candidatus Altiarchaeota archaeon]
MDFINSAYLVSAVLFILGLKKLGSARTARAGNQFALLGMLVAMVVTLFDEGIVDYSYIIAGVVVGTLIGAVSAKKVKMTDMPQFVALFNGFGGLASFLVASAEFLNMTSTPATDVSVTLLLSLLIGMVTFTGSYIAFAKLQGIMRSAPISFPFHQSLNTMLLLVTVVAGVFYVLDPMLVWPIVTVSLIAAVLGILFVIPIGGADMPVVISLLNSYSGIAAAMTGFVLSNNVLIIS